MSMYLGKNYTVINKDVIERVENIVTKQKLLIMTDGYTMF